MLELLEYISFAISPAFPNSVNEESGQSYIIVLLYYDCWGDWNETTWNNALVENT